MSKGGPVDVGRFMPAIRSICRRVLICEELKTLAANLEGAERKRAERIFELFTPKETKWKTKQTGW
jgi:hypothetical protein